MDSVTFTDWFADHYALQRLKYRYCYCIDDGRIDDFADLFVKDAVVEFATRPPYKGRSEIRGFLMEHVTESADMSHLATNPLIDINGDAATGTWDYLVFLSGTDGSEVGVGVYHETYRRDNGNWKFESIRTERRFTHVI